MKGQPIEVNAPEGFVPITQPFHRSEMWMLKNYEADLDRGHIPHVRVEAGTGRWAGVVLCRARTGMKFTEDTQP